MGTANGKIRRNKNVLRCEGKRHVYIETQFCDRNNCKNRICEACLYTYKDTEDKYCQMCTLSIRNQEEGEDISAAEEMAFAEENKDQQEKFSMVKVKRDMKSGEIQGWKEFYELVQMSSDEPLTPEEVTFMKMQKVEEKMKKTQAQTYLVMEDQSKIEEKIVMIKNIETSEEIEVAVIRSDRGEQTYLNLPPELQDFMFNYTKQEIYDDFLNVMECLTVMHAAMGGSGNVGDSMVNFASAVELPSASEFEENLEKHAIFREDDPSNEYLITSENKLGTGGFAKVFLVKRRKDGKLCALKFIETKSNREKKLMKNEVALMNMSSEKKGSEYVLEIYESFDYKDRLWIFVELMDCALTPIIEECQDTYSENCLKYVLR